MASDDPVTDIRELWRRQPLEEEPISMEQLRARVIRLQRTVRWRNAREYAGALVGAVLVAPALWSQGSALVRIGAGLLMAACAYVAYQLHARGAAGRLPDAGTAASCVEFHRAELAKQRDLLRSVWSWYLLPFAPGLASIALGAAVARPDRWQAAALFAVAAAGAFAAIGWLNVRAAADIQRQLDHLDRQP